MKERKKFITSIIVVVAIIAIVAGGTYAFWQWTAETNERTIINLTVPDNNAMLSASLDGGTITVTDLAPVSSCLNSNYVAKSTVVLNYSNQTATAATITGTLTVTGFTAPHGTPSSAALGHLNYALTTSASSCDDAITDGTFSGKATANSKLFEDITLESNIAAGTTNGSKTMYLYIWIDSGYSYINSGTIDDPMQDLTISLSWSGSITNS